MFISGGDMGKKGGRIDILPGTLDLMILKAVAGTPLHGFGIARWIEDVTGERLVIDEGALYPALHKLEKRGVLQSDWQMTENRRRARYYELTDAGREALGVETARWTDASWAVNQVLETDR